MFDEPPAPVRPLGSVALRRRLYRSLARVLGSSPHGSVVAFESTTDRPIPWITARPGSILDVARADPSLGSCPLESADASSFPVPWKEAYVRFATLVLRRGGRSAAEPLPERPVAGALTGPAGRLGTQTFWVARPSGAVSVARRIGFEAGDRSETVRRFDAVALAAARAWGDSVDAPARAVRSGFGVPRDWARLAASSLPRDAWVVVSPERLERTAEGPGPEPSPIGRDANGHTIVLGASGAGKTWFLADRSADAIRRGEPVFVVDLHGDLSPAIVARLDPGALRRVVAVDLSDLPVPGIAAIGPTLDPERAAAHLVAALKRMTPDGSEVYWGYRLERIFDGFVRLAHETGGSLADVHAMLTDPDRRDGARLATRSADLVRFLDDLAAVVRRNPEFLWGAAARLSKVVGSPALAGLLAPPDGGIPAEDVLVQGRSILVRAPFGLLGPESAAFAGTLVLARVYLGLAARRSEAPGGRPILVVLDEVQGFSPRLVSEMVSEGRKFGLRLLVATQYPERLARELRAAVAGAAREYVSFRVPLATAGTVGRWFGLSTAEARRGLADLPPGHGLVLDPERASLGTLVPRSGAVGADAPRWANAVRASRAEFGPTEPRDAGPDVSDLATERILLAVLGADEEGSPLPREAVVPAAERCPGPAVDPATLADRLPGLERRGLLADGRDGVRLTPAGERWLGLGAPTQAHRETPEHRRLLLAAFRVFARRGCRLEIVRQGRYDTRLPDARFRQLPDRSRSGPPVELSRLLDRVRDGWAWRYFGGLDVHVEAEVSGAVRPERIRHGLSKASARGAFALFLVGDAHRASRVRRTLAALGVGPDRARVWTLRPLGSPPASLPREPATAGLPPESRPRGT